MHRPRAVGGSSNAVEAPRRRSSSSLLLLAVAAFLLFCFASGRRSSTTTSSIPLATPAPWRGSADVTLLDKWESYADCLQVGLKVADGASANGGGSNCTMRGGNTPGRNLIETPQEQPTLKSSVEKRRSIPLPHGESEPFVTIKNVHYANGTFTVYLPPGGKTDEMPSVYEFKPDMQSTRSIHFNYVMGQQQGQQPCAGYLNKKAMIFHAPFAENVFHFFNDGILAVWDTARQTGLLPAAGAALCQPNRDLTLLALDKSAFHSPQWAFLFGCIADDLRQLSDMEGYCFKEVHVGTSRLLDFYVEPWGEEPTLARAQALQQFQRFAFNASMHHERCQGRDVSQFCYTGIVSEGKACPKQLSTRPMVLVASRNHSRALTNENELIAYITRQYNVDVIKTEFKMPLLDVIHLVQHAHMMIGMHGAGMTNAIFLPRDSSSIQLFPYGWKLPTEKHPIRGSYYQLMAKAAGSKAFQWINPYAENAFFSKYEFEQEGEGEKFMEHPDDTMEMPKDWNPKRYWVFQNTKVDLRSIGPVLDDAFKAAGIQRSAAKQ